jgi:hypothetical protein
VAIRALGCVTVATDLDAERWLPLAEAAAELGLSRHALRRRVRAGQITSRQVQRPHGPTYEVLLDPDATVASAVRQGDARNGGATATVTPPLAELVTLVRDLQADVVRHAAAAAMYQERCRVLEAQVDQLRALPAPTDRLADAPRRESDVVGRDRPQTPAPSPKRAWWRLW